MGFFFVGAFVSSPNDWAGSRVMFVYKGGVRFFLLLLPTRIDTLGPAIL